MDVISKIRLVPYITNVDTEPKKWYQRIKSQHLISKKNVPVLAVSTTAKVYKRVFRKTNMSVASLSLRPEVTASPVTSRKSPIDPVSPDHIESINIEASIS
jgi:hypothetical protein